MVKPRLIVRCRIWLGALALLAASPAFATPIAKPDTIGKRAARKLLSASDKTRAKFLAKKPELLELALRHFGLRRTALRADFMKQHNDQYSNELPPTPVRKQGFSGRCYLFAASNVVGGDISRSYLDARDIQARAYESLQTGAKLTSLTETLQPKMGEGGSWSRAAALLETYGAVPEHVMPDTYDATHSAVAIKLLDRTLVAAQEKLRHLPRNSAEETAIIHQAQADIDRIIARAFTGKDKLPETFVLDGKEVTARSYAAEHLKFKSSDYITLQDENAQRAGWNMNGLGLQRMETYNTKSIELMKEAVRASIDQGKAVYISAPVNDGSAPFMQPHETAEIERATKGVISIAAWDYGSIGIPDVKIDRGLASASGIHPQNHAMTIVGYDLDPKTGKVIKWKVQNSWGEEVADHGYQHMYDDFFTAFVGNATVPRSALSAAMRKQVEDEYTTWNNFAWQPK
jgi:bleomycin hydrolase